MWVFTKAKSTSREEQVFKINLKNIHSRIKDKNSLKRLRKLRFFSPNNGLSREEQRFFLISKLKIWDYAWLILYIRSRVVFLLRRIQYWLVLFKRISYSGYFAHKNQTNQFLDKIIQFSFSILLTRIRQNQILHIRILNLGRRHSVPSSRTRCLLFRTIILPWGRRIWTYKFFTGETWILKKEFNFCSKDFNFILI